MTLSIEVLPAPFGPMMARTSPFLMSNDTSRIARTPPNDSDTFSIESSTSPAAMSLAAGALMPPSQARRDRHGRHVADLHARRDRALAAVLEGHLGGDVGLGRAVIERLDQRRVALGDEAAAHLLGPRHLAVVGVELLVQDQEALDLRARRHLVLGERAVGLLDVLAGSCRRPADGRPAPGRSRRPRCCARPSFRPRSRSMLIITATKSRPSP